MGVAEIELSDREASSLSRDGTSLRLSSSRSISAILDALATVSVSRVVGMCGGSLWRILLTGGATGVPSSHSKIGHPSSSRSGACSTSAKL